MNSIDLNHVTISWISVSDMANNVYLVTAKESGQQVIIDAADDSAAIAGLIEAHGNASIAAILTTHSHWDHVRALKDIAQRYGAKILAGLYDVSAIEEQSGIEVDEQIAHADMIEFDGFRLKAIHLRGHTPGSIAYVLRDYPTETRIVFSGDSLFPGGVGKTTSEEDFASLIDDVEERIFGVYADDTIVLPGHGDSTTLGAQRPQLSEWRSRGW